MTARSTFWTDLNRHLENSKFRRTYVATSLEIQAVDDYVNATGQMPSRRERRRIRKAAYAGVSQWSDGQPPSAL